MALTKRAIAFLMIMVLLRVSFGAVYNVGDDDGWTDIGNIDYSYSFFFKIFDPENVDYSYWADSKNFHVGDTLVFEYNNQFHNVEQVTQQDFQSCNPTSPIALYNSGSDTITLDRPGHFYFLCGFSDHCEAGQKVHIVVTRASASEAPSPVQNSAHVSKSSMILMTLVVLVFSVTTYAY